MFYYHSEHSLEISRKQKWTEYVNMVLSSLVFYFKVYLFICSHPIQTVYAHTATIISCANIYEVISAETSTILMLLSALEVQVLATYLSFTIAVLAHNPFPTFYI